MNSAGLIGKLPVLSAAIALAAVACAPARAQGSPDRSAAAAEMTVDAQGMSRRTVLETFFAGSGSTVAWVDEKAASEALYGVYKGRADMAILRRVLNGLNFVAIQPDASGGSPVFEIVVYGEAAARGSVAAQPIAADPLKRVYRGFPPGNPLLAYKQRLAR